jgi:uncharacterized protein (DUF1330 family)
LDSKLKARRESGMAAYVIAAIQSVSDPATYSEYGRLAGPSLEQYGGKIVVGGNKIEVADGNWSPDRMVIIEFESLEQAKKWYNSPEYSPLVSMRTESSEGGLIFIDGS